MSIPFFILTVLFIVAATVMVLIILVQRPQGGGLAGAFGGAGGGGTDTVFGGRVGDALTTMTVICFVVYIGLAIGLNKLPPGQAPPPDETTLTAPPETGIPAGGGPVPVTIDPSRQPGQPGQFIPVTPGEVPQDVLDRAAEDAARKAGESEPAPVDPPGGSE